MNNKLDTSPHHQNGPCSVASMNAKERKAWLLRFHVQLHPISALFFDLTNIMEVGAFYKEYSPCDVSIHKDMPLRTMDKARESHISVKHAIRSDIS